MDFYSVYEDFENSVFEAMGNIDHRPIDRTPFEHTHRCSFSPKDIGNRIIMPQSALPSLEEKSVEQPWLFDLCNPLTGKISHCGVLEFTSDEGFVLLPKLMMDFMEFEDGDLLTMTSASLQKGTFLKLQPHKKKFMELENPKAVLENTLKEYCCLTIGDTIIVTHGNDAFYVDIVDANPSFAVNLLDTDCEVEFALPLDYEPPAPPKREQEKAKVEEKQPIVEEQTAEFKAFSGVARRLDGAVNYADDHSKMTAAAKRIEPCGSSKKVVLGSNILQNSHQQESNCCNEKDTKKSSKHSWEKVTG
ncbi:Ubiquitin fusion degradation protein UFD1 [Corchorus olitorius]|uniref:Ubiquitin fusion degradation protein UFD1 n=1 Tax=Corchorus olitorius TaxID=93759 RepID=A0A1R3HDY0_9ROSI|nr:Ubiquitin fusion degradation protein UFD1 [Corchorus olitorius]